MFTVIHFLKMLLQIEMFWNKCSVEERKPLKNGAGQAAAKCVRHKHY